MPGHAGECQWFAGMPGNAGTCRGMPGNAGTCRGMPVITLQYGILKKLGLWRAANSTYMNSYVNGRFGHQSGASRMRTGTWSCEMFFFHLPDVSVKPTLKSIHTAARSVVLRCRKNRCVSVDHTLQVLWQFVVHRNRGMVEKTALPESLESPGNTFDSLKALSKMDGFWNISWKGHYLEDPFIWQSPKH